MTEQLGMDCIVYRNTGTYASPTWVEMDWVMTANHNLTANEGKVKKRASDIELTLKGQGVHEFTVEGPYDADDANITALDTAVRTRTDPIEFAFMDDDITTSGVKGIRTTCEVVAGGRTEGFEEAVGKTFTLKPSAKATNPFVEYTVP